MANQITITERYIVASKNWNPGPIVVTVKGLVASIKRGATFEAIERLTLTPAAQYFWAYYQESESFVKDDMLRKPDLYIELFVNSKFGWS